MITTINEKNFEFYINNNDMENGKPNFTEYLGMPLKNGSLAINMDTKKGFFWDEEAQEWK